MRTIYHPCSYRTLAPTTSTTIAHPDIVTDTAVHTDTADSEIPSGIATTISTSSIPTTLATTNPISVATYIQRSSMSMHNCHLHTGGTPTLGNSSNTTITNPRSYVHPVPTRPTVSPQVARFRGDDGRFVHLSAGDLQPDTMVPHVSKICGWCRTSTTPQWRLGPTTGSIEMYTLCNKCGINYRRALRKAAPGTLNLDRLARQIGRSNLSIHKAVKYQQQMQSCTTGTATRSILLSSTTMIAKKTRTNVQVPRRIIFPNDGEPSANFGTAPEMKKRHDFGADVCQLSSDRPDAHARAGDAATGGANSIAALCSPFDIPVQELQANSVLPACHPDLSITQNNEPYSCAHAPIRKQAINSPNITSSMETSDESENTSGGDVALDRYSLYESAAITHLHGQRSQSPVSIASFSSTPISLLPTPHAFPNNWPVLPLPPSTAAGATTTTSLLHGHRVMTGVGEETYTPLHGPWVPAAPTGTWVAPSCSASRNEVRCTLENRKTAATTTSISHLRPLLDCHALHHWRLPPVRTLIGELHCAPYQL